MKPYKRKNSKYYWVKYTYNGKQIATSTKQIIKADAAKWIKEYIEPLINQTNIKGLAEQIKLMTVKNPILLDNAFDEFNQKNSKPCGAKRHEQKLYEWTNFIDFVKCYDPSIKFVHQLTEEICIIYINFIRKNGRFIFKNKGTGAHSPRTSNNYLITLRQISSILFNDNELIKDPFRNIKKLESDDEHKEAFTIDELRRIGKSANDFILSIFVLGMYTGLRKGDLCTLKWSQVDMENRWIETKTAKTKKTVKIPILPVLYNYLFSLPKLNEYVLPDHAQQYIKSPTNNYIGIKVKRFLERELKIKTTKQIPGRTRELSIKDIHSLRHTFVYLAAENGVPLSIIQSVVGHMTEKMTQIYANHATDLSKKEQIYIPNHLGLPEPEQLTNEDEYNLLQIKMILSRSMSPVQKMNEIRALLENDTIDVKAN